MNVTYYGHVVQQRAVRIYIYSDLGPIRPIFHNLYQTLVRQMTDVALCTVILLRSNGNQYHEFRKFTDRSFWQALKQLSAEGMADLQSLIRLEKQLALHPVEQTIIVTSGSQPTDEDVAQLEKWTLNGLTVIRLHGEVEKRLLPKSS
jgi:hypothetical protein